MRFAKSLIALFAFVFFQPSTAAAAKLEFATSPVNLTLPMERPISFDLMTTLKGTGTGGVLAWGIRPSATNPPWLSVPKDSSLLKGTPPAGVTGIFKFIVGVVEMGPGGVPLDGGTSAEFSLTLVSVPKWSVTSVDLGKTAEGASFVPVDLRTLASDPSGAALTFSLDDPSGKFPSWLTLNSNGMVTANRLPLRPDVGVFNGFNFVAKTSSGGTTPISAFGEVLKVFKGPRWTANPIGLPDATEDSPYTQSVSGTAFVLYGESQTLKFEVYDGTNKAWLAMSDAGLITGTPTRPNGGAVTLLARVSTTYQGTVYKDETVLKFKVNLVNKPPVWSSNTIVLPDAYTRTAYGPQDLKTFVTDIDGNPLTFSFLSWSGPGQAWATLNGSALSGTPLNSSLGLHEWMVEVFDGEFKVPTKVQITVKNRPPLWKTHPVVLKPNATEDAPYSVGLAPFAQDPESDPLVFNIEGGPAWASINNLGQLVGTPHRGDIGLQVFKIRVSDALSGGSDLADVQVMVNKINKPPQWNEPIVLPDAPERSPYSQFLSNYASDPDTADVLTYKKIDGPAWATVDATTGEIKGTPQRADLGKFPYTIQVSDPAGLFARTTVFITVTKVNRSPLCASPANLKDAFQDGAYSYDVHALVTDADGDALVFTPTSVPPWMTAGTDGKLSGTPLEAHIGTYRAEFDVADPDGATCHLSADGKVLRTNWPPVVHSPIQVTVKERQVFPLNLKNPQYVEDQDGTASLVFTPAGWPAWATMTSAGAVTLRPLFAQISPPVHALDFSVTDGKSTASGTIQVTVVRDPRPPVWNSDTILFTAVAGQPFSNTLADKVVDRDGLPLLFEQNSGPTSAWLTIGTDGKISGTPAETDVGDNLYKVTARNDAASAQVSMIVRVRTANHPPRWTKKPIKLPDAYVGENYTQTLSALATDEDINDKLSFERMTPSWAFITTSGLVIGTPVLSDLGLNRVTVRVKDLVGAFDEVEVQITVRQRGERPRWTRDPIDLGTAYVSKPFSFDLNPLVIDPDGNTLTFRKAASAPAWLFVSGNGQVTGTPQIADVGPYTTVFEVSDDTVTWVAVNAFGKVMKQVAPPKLNLSALFFTVRVDETLDADLNQPLYVNNPDGDPLTFEILQGEAWVTLSASGKLALKPKAAQLGDHTFQVRISGASGATDQGPLHVKVIKGAEPIKWLEDPIRYSTIVNKPFSANLAAKVSNPDAVSLIYTKGSGAAWLDLTPNGLLTGQPTKVGDEFFSVSFTPSGKSLVLATLIISVLPDAPHEDGVRIDEPVPGARVDNLWVVDNSPDPCVGQSCLIHWLRTSVDTYYSKLEKAGIHHYGIYLSSDACAYRKPIVDSRGQVLLSWDDRMWTKSFNNRIDRSRGQAFYNSPVVATWNFLYSSLLTAPAPYFESKVPMEAIFISQSGDQYKNYAWPQIAGWTPSQFAQYSLSEHKKANKSLRISALAVSGSGAYQASVNATAGKYYSYNGTRTSVDLAIDDYADQVIFRAYVNAKKRIKLSKTPTDPTTIKVTLAGSVLPATHWKYDAATNEVEIFWNLIDLSALKPGDRIVIQYR